MPGLLRCTCGDYARVLYLISHARLRAHWAPGIPHALAVPGRTFLQKLGRIAPRDRGVVFDVIARSEATKQSILSCCSMDCFASLAMTVSNAPHPQSSSPGLRPGDP